MNVIRFALVSCLALVLVACQTTGQVAQVRPDLRPGSTRIALMPMELQLYQLTAGGVREPRAEWTRDAEVHVRRAISVIQAEKQLQLVKFDASTLPLERQKVMDQLVKLHGVVGGEIFLQARIPQRRPPTKQGRFDWSIGTEVRSVAEATGARYGLFIFLEDSYSSGGRVALGIAMALLGVGIQGGQQIGYASLVDLNTGQIAWFGTIARGSGDLRTEAAAEDSLRSLFSTLPNG